MNDLTFSYLDNDAPGQDALDAFVRAHPEGNAYQLTAWRRAVADAYGYPGQVLVARREGELAGILPLCQVARPLSRPRWISLPFCDIGARWGPQMRSTRHWWNRCGATSCQRAPPGLSCAARPPQPRTKRRSKGARCAWYSICRRAPQR